MPKKTQRPDLANNTNNLRHGGHRMNRCMVYDGRSKTAKAVHYFQNALTESLGGRDALSIQQQIVVDRLAFSVTRCMMFESTMIDQNGGVSTELKHEYFMWRRHLREDLKLIGLEKRARQIQNVKQYVEENYGRKEESSNYLESKKINEPVSPQNFSKNEKGNLSDFSSSEVDDVKIFTTSEVEIEK